MSALAVVALAASAPASVAPTSVSPNTRVNARAAGQLVEDFKSPAVAVDPADTRRVVTVSRNDQPDFNCRIDRSADGGATWSPASFPPPPAGTCWSPGVAWDAAGNVYVAAQNRPPGGGAQNMIVWRSSDGGQTFAAPVVIPGSSGNQAGIAVDTHAASPFRGRIYVTWYAFPSFPSSIDTFLSFSDDSGQTWSTPVRRPVAGQFQTFPHPAVAPDGTVYVVFKDTASNFFTSNPPPAVLTGCLGVSGVGNPANGATCPIRVLRSSNGGVSFDADPFTVATANFRDLSVGEQPGLAVTPAGTVLVTFSSIRTPSAPGCASSLDAFVARSSDRAASWSPAVRIDDDACTGGATQRNPWISVAPNGRVDAVFYDNRDDASDPRTSYGVRYSNSTDDGQSFGVNAKINDTDFDTTTLLAPRPTGFQSNEFDQVNGIASTNASALAAWGDTREAPSPSSSRSDVFSTVIGLTAAPGPSPAPDPEPQPGPLPPPAPVPPGTRRDDQRPVISEASAFPATFEIGSLLPRLVRASRVGTTIRLRLSEPATLRLSFARARPGRRVGRSCRRPTRALRGRRPCARFVTVPPAVVIRGARAGRNSVRFEGRLTRRRTLRPGRHRLTLTATDAAGNRSRATRVGLRLTRRRASP